MSRISCQFHSSQLTKCLNMRKISLNSGFVALITQNLRSRKFTILRTQRKLRHFSPLKAYFYMGPFAAFLDCFNFVDLVFLSDRGALVDGGGEIGGRFGESAGEGCRAAGVV